MIIKHLYQHILSLGSICHGIIPAKILSSSNQDPREVVRRLLPLVHPKSNLVMGTKDPFLRNPMGLKWEYAQDLFEFWGTCKTCADLFIEIYVVYRFNQHQKKYTNTKWFKFLLGRPRKWFSLKKIQPHTAPFFTVFPLVSFSSKESPKNDFLVNLKFIGSAFSKIQRRNPLVCHIYSCPIIKTISQYLDKQVKRNVCNI